MHICYLASEGTMPRAVKRRKDAFEHDQMMTALLPPIKAEGGTLVDVCWDEPNVDWGNYDAVLIGTTWDYPDRLSAFLAVLSHIDKQTSLYNTPKLVRWNSDKRYLRDMADRGVRIVPTLWLDHVTPADAQAAFQTLERDDLVFKRQVGANADGQYRLKVGGTIPHMPEPMMVQPFLKAIKDEGEISFIFIDGEFCHAVQKKPVAGDYRIQSIYGGIETIYTPREQELAEVRYVLETLDEMPLYARVDMVRGDDGLLCVMELEMVEPFLYPLQGPALGTKIYQALKRRHLAK